MTDKNTLYEIRRALFETTAARYQRIVPAFDPLARRLVDLAALQPAERVIDLGAGTGIVAWRAGRAAQQVIGLDYVGPMLALAHQQAPAGDANHVAFHQADMHRLPYAADAFHVALASFGFNGIDPQLVFPEIRRILRPGGRLIFQEWGEVEEASRIVKQAVKGRRVPQAEGFLADLRLLGDTPDAWDELEDEEDIARLLRKVGFREVKVFIEQEAVPLEPLVFFEYKTAWAPYQAELAAMAAEKRAAVQAEVLDRLKAWLGPDGRFIWKPELVRFIAWK